MRRPRHNIWFEAVLWVIAEILLNSSGLDTLADYSEFLVSQRMNVIGSSGVVYLVEQTRTAA